MREQDVEEDGGFIAEAREDGPRRATEEDQILVPLFLNRRCKYCSQVPIDDEVERTFEIPVCRSCCYRNLKFITKTSSLCDYLLTNEELRNFKFLVRPNPHKGTWSKMNLYLESQVREFAVGKWGSMDEVWREKEKRSRMLEDRKVKKLQSKIRDLRRMTRFSSKNGEKHVHDFVLSDGVSKCRCGMSVDQEEF